jgi:hypothetical protein
MKINLSLDELNEMRGLLSRRSNVIAELNSSIRISLRFLLTTTFRCQDAWTAEAMFRRGIPMTEKNVKEFVAKTVGEQK